MEMLDRRTHYPVAVDCVIFGYDGIELKVALIERKKLPFLGYWGLPGGFLIGIETVEQAAYRKLQEETGIHDIYLEQFHVFSNPDRDPRGHVITVAFFALIASDKIELEPTTNVVRAQWFSAYQIPQLAFDHNEIYTKALEALRIAIIIKPLVFKLLPKQFTLTMLQNLYEQIVGYSIDKRNFRKKILKDGYVQQTTKTTNGGQHRPAKLYKFNKSRYTYYPTMF
ncbi:NUDIX hydrolase [Candidatus Chromulinivorax destructor]|uniref:NUDIX hydrolase n=1 Tax=Candidatus Chromulinivorax destructor TaxID=2066483 RepID=A0A345ZAQ3_9BACT|nr:NUDIX domain-containing protein [Candidatus Chromulinivorax destructor]AXK60370.1 NUDIX hydrolase [Candidatus Chromulinivorax destructor]